MRIAALMQLLIFAFILIASRSKFSLFHARKYKETINCSEDMECGWDADIEGSRCKCMMCVYYSKAPTKEM
ncbi:hypothetical protein ZWY2020_031694 [Hordeum vulgare]|nr:hypothetical protein ZWY2020_031694 [Hordeum vulgare]